MNAIIHEARYEAAKKARIERNARVGARRRMCEAEADAQRLIDFLEGNGEFADAWVAKDPADQAAMDAQIAAIDWSRDAVTCPHQELDCILTDFDARRVPNPIRQGIFAGDFGQMMAKFHDEVSMGGGLTPKMAEVVRKSIAKRTEWAAKRDADRAERLAADRATSGFVGEVGERREWELTVEKTFSFETQFGATYINICRDADQNVIVYKGSNGWDRGAVIKCKATVKAHDVRDGVSQTLIARPKVTA